MDLVNGLSAGVTGLNLAGRFLGRVQPLRWVYSGVRPTQPQLGCLGLLPVPRAARATDRDASNSAEADFRGAGPLLPALTSLQ